MPLLRALPLVVCVFVCACVCVCVCVCERPLHVSGSVVSEHVTHIVSHVGSHAGRGQARRLHARTAAHHHLQARKQAARGRTHTSDRHTQDTQDGRRATTHSACTCRWTSVKHRVGWVGITEASAACAHTEPSSRPPVRALSDRYAAGFCMHQQAVSSAQSAV